MSSSTINTPRAFKAVHLQEKTFKKVAANPVVGNNVVLVKVKFLQTLQNTSGLTLTPATENQRVYPNERKENSYQPELCLVYLAGFQATYFVCVMNV